MNSSASAPSRTTWTLLARLWFLKACSASISSLGLSSTSRISMLFSGIDGTSFKSEGKSGTPVDLDLRPDPAAVTVDDPLHDGQTNASTVVIDRAVQPLKDAEEF